MPKVKVQRTYDIDIIYVPDFIQDDIIRYQDNFLMWVDNTSFDENLDGTVFGTDDFIRYLNEEVLKNQAEKAYIIKTDYIPKSEREKRELKRLKKIYF